MHHAEEHSTAVGAEFELKAFECEEDMEVKGLHLKWE